MRIKLAKGKKKTALASRSRWESYSQVLIAGSIVSVFFAAIGYMGTDIWLASTQWLIIAGVLAALGVYAKLETG